MPVRTNPLVAAIAAGQSLSAAVQLNGIMVENIIMPAAWTAAGLSFAVCETETGTFLPLTDALGAEVTITVAASKAVMMPIGAVRGHNWIKLQSGTSAAAVNQVAAASVTLLCRDFS